MYKLIALDMDGTLLGPDKQISPANRAAIEAAKARGIKVVLASGRPLEGLTDHLQSLGLTTNEDYVLCYNGALIQRVGTGEVVSSTTLHGGHGRDLYELSQVLDVHIHGFSRSEGLITPKSNPWTELEANINGINLAERDFRSLDDDHEIVKLMLVEEGPLLDNAVANLPPELYQRYTILRSAPYFLEFLNKDSNKGAGVAQLASLLGLEPDEVICVGDADNDRHMLQYAGLGVAMGNADDEIKALADHVTASNAEDGVALVIEQFILAD